MPERQPSIEDLLTDAHERVHDAGGRGWAVAMCLDPDSLWWEAREGGRAPIQAATLDVLCERVTRRIERRKAVRR
jgi:hypothetical protein